MPPTTLRFLSLPITIGCWQMASNISCYHIYSYKNLKIMFATRLASLFLVANEAFGKVNFLNYQYILLVLQQQVCIGGEPAAEKLLFYIAQNIVRNNHIASNSPKSFARFTSSRKYPIPPEMVTYFFLIGLAEYCFPLSINHMSKDIKLLLRAQRARRSRQVLSRVDFWTHYTEYPFPILFFDVEFFYNLFYHKEL